MIIADVAGGSTGLVIVTAATATGGIGVTDLADLIAMTDVIADVAGN